MKTIRRIVAIIAAALAAALLVTWAAEPPGYKVDEEVMVSGKVTSVSTVPDWMGKDGLNIALLSAGIAVPHVDVATASFMRRFEFPIAVGDDLTMTGCWSTASDGQRVFLVHSLNKKQITLNVRDPMGAPLW
ncbi:MAG TPA: hypothetical protein VJ826_14495 [Candidatus Polarisedimenticolaceae bacterium]|nr:hypothetical protein [Candidatus Polarisedimenticolaceae bacterium]